MRAHPLASVLVLSTLFMASGCPPKERLGVSAMSIVGSGVVNDPKNKSLRFDLLKFGLEEFCTEMRRRGAPLKLRDGEPVVGRFFANHCSSQVLDDETRQSLVVQYQGRGYAWTNISQRIGFESSGLIEYAPDFQLHDGAMYIYFRPRNLDSTSFKTSLVESQLARTGIAVTGLDPDAIGKNIVDSQLKRGFTVIRYTSRGETEIGMGYIPVGERPFRPFNIVQSEKITLDNDRTEVHTGQQDFVGGFTVTDDDQALYLTIKVEGAPGIDVFVVPDGTGSRLIEHYVTRPGPAPVTEPPLLDEAVPAGQQFKRFVPLSKGTYYLLLDHTAPVGRTAPPAIAGDDRAARVDYVVQLGERP